MEDNTPNQAVPPITTEDKVFMLACHLSPFVSLALIIPFVVYLIKKDEASRVTEHAKEALNFHISVTLYCIVSLVLCIIGIGFLLLFALAAFVVFCSILAAIKAVDDKLFRYPLTLRLVK